MNTSTQPKLSPNQKKAFFNFYSWRKSTAYDLCDVYGSYSSRKAAAWRHCREVCRSHNGQDLRVVSHNTNFFTAGFEYLDPATGVMMYYHIAPSYEAAVARPDVGGDAQ